MGPIIHPPTDIWQYLTKLCVIDHISRENIWQS